MSTATQTAAVPREAATGEPSPRRNRVLGDRLTPRRAAFMVPAVVMLVLFMAGPIIYSVWLAFTNAAIRGEGADQTDFIGVDNFVRAFTDAGFWNSVVLTVIFTVVSAVIGQNILGMILALLMERASRIASRVITTIVIVAWVLPEVVAGYLLYTFLSEEGSLNGVLGALSMPEQNWLFSAPIWAVSFANIWRGTAFTMLMYSAALSSVPADVQESAQIDGAGAFRRFFSITVPLIRPVIATNLMLITLQTLSVFGLIFIMTGGGPNNRSQTLPLYMYEQAFSYGQLGYGTAVALLLLLIGAIASLVYLKLLPEEDKR